MTFADLFRTALDRPGFVLFDLGPNESPESFRRRLLTIGDDLAAYYRTHHGGELRFVSVGRFDQQRATKPHRDGGPDRSILLLGYEPSEVESTLSLIDHTRAAADRGLTPQGFLDVCNPQFVEYGDTLKPYTTTVATNDPVNYRVLLVNNGNEPLPAAATGMLGVLHHADIPRPRADKTRFIASVLMGVTAVGLGDDALAAFVESGAGATA